MTKKKSPFPEGWSLGEPVRYTAVYDRVETWRDGAKVVHWDVLPLPSKAEGFLVGWRKLALGYTRFSEDGPEWKHTGVVFCAKVVFDLHKASVEVPLTHLEKRP